MIPYIGDFAEDATVYHYFNTFDSNDPSNSVTITNLASTDLHVHKDGSTTQATGGETITLDFDSITGTHLVTIDTSSEAYYAIGSDYMVRMEGTTIDGGTVNAALFTFSIENRYNAAADDLANGTDGLGALSTKLDTIDDFLDTEIAAITAAVITNAVGADVSADIATAQNDLDTITGASGVNLLTATQASIDAIEADTNELQADDIPGKLVTLDAVVDTVKVDTAAIKAKTDSLAFTEAGYVDANTLKINGASLVGDGNGTPWDGA